ncbi:MAG: hypothetical protein PVG39_31945 [Desulfobacteraceae bacterium]|jgi:hypothetical protein
MAIDKFIEKVCVQTAVYWGNPQPDGYGGETFDTPVEINCRWEDKEELSRQDIARDFISKSEILLTQDVNVGGWLYLGELTDLDSNPDNPREIEGAYIIGRFDKVPMIFSTTIFVRKAYVGWQRGG